MRLSRLPARKLAPASTLLQMRQRARPQVHRVTGRRNRLLALALWRMAGGLCARCGLEIDPTIHYTLPGALTIGHKTPISRGGSNELANLGPEHRRCNLDAGNREPRAIASPVRP